MKSVSIKVNDPWDSLKKFTPARIAIGRVGSSIPLKQALEFKLAHAHARDAVYSTLNSEILIIFNTLIFQYWSCIAKQKTGNNIYKDQI